jgi:hypothetical protein
LVYGFVALMIFLGSVHGSLGNVFVVVVVGVAGVKCKARYTQCNRMFPLGLYAFIVCVKTVVG